MKKEIYAGFQQGVYGTLEFHELMKRWGAETCINTSMLRDPTIWVYHLPNPYHATLVFKASAGDKRTTITLIGERKSVLKLEERFQEESAKFNLDSLPEDVQMDRFLLSELRPLVEIG